MIRIKRCVAALSDSIPAVLAIFALLWHFTTPIALAQTQLRALEPSPFISDSLGLKINLPAGAEVLSERVNSKLVVVVSNAMVDPATGQRTPPTWTMRIQQMVSATPDATPATQIDELLRDYNLNRLQYKVLSNSPVAYGNAEGQLCFLELTAANDQPYVSGWLILPSGTQSFLVFSAQTLPERFASLQDTLQASFATIELRNAEELASERKARLEAGREFLELTTPERLQKLVGLNQWFRIYTNNPEGSTTERGYSRIQVLEAQRGALEPKKNPKKYTPDERKHGIMIRVEGRVVVNAPRGVYYDSVGQYWMAWDQSEEAWSVLGTHRQGEAEQSEAETAIRGAATTGKPIATLNVIKSDNTTNSREPFSWEVPDVYLSQPIHWLLGKLLPTDVIAPREYSFYFYNFANASPQVSQRIDVWEPTTESGGAFKLTTRLTADAPPTTSVYGGDGTLIRRVHPDGSITEPTTPDAIRKLWKSKGLAVGKSG